jgi:hypothetical protein
MKDILNEGAAFLYKSYLESWAYWLTSCYLFLETRSGLPSKSRNDTLENKRALETQLPQYYRTTFHDDY